jgi:hypothetical protein
MSVNGIYIHIYVSNREVYMYVYYFKIIMYIYIMYTYMLFIILYYVTLFQNNCHFPKGVKSKTTRSDFYENLTFNIKRL